MRTLLVKNHDNAEHSRLACLNFAGECGKSFVKRGTIESYARRYDFQIAAGGAMPDPV
jgi:hypothetical protein